MSNEITYPSNWVASEKELKNGWSNAPAILSEITSFVNDDKYIEDESDFMEYVDLILNYMKLHYTITP